MDGKKGLFLMAEETGNVYALIRVSTERQKEDRQLTRMTKLGILKKNIVIEKESGKSTKREKYHKLVKRLNKGDTLYIENIDRLSRDYDGIINEWHILTKQKGIIIKVIDTPMLNTDRTDNSLLIKFIRNILLHILAFQAENEWHKIKNRQAQGIAVAKSDGKHLGRPKAVRTKKELKIAKQYLNREVDLITALSLLNVKKSAFYNICRILSDNENF